jgi:hypothetical protein
VNFAFTEFYEVRRCTSACRSRWPMGLRLGTKRATSSHISVLWNPEAFAELPFFQGQLEGQLD